MIIERRGSTPPTNETPPNRLLADMRSVRPDGIIRIMRTEEQTVYQGQDFINESHVAKEIGAHIRVITSPHTSAEETLEGLKNAGVIETLLYYPVDPIIPAYRIVEGNNGLILSEQVLARVKEGINSESTRSQRIDAVTRSYQVYFDALLEYAQHQQIMQSFQR